MEILSHVDANGAVLSGYKLLKNGVPNIEDEPIFIFRLFKLALETEYWQIADECMAKLRKVASPLFINRMKALRCEARGELDRALAIYKNILQESALDKVSRNRIVSIEKSRGNFNGAIELLNLHLKDVMADFEAWRELSKIYSYLGEIQKSLFCSEEVLMYRTRNVPDILRAADLQLANQNPQTARKYYSAALLIDENNFQAMLAILLCLRLQFDRKSNTYTDLEKAISRKLSTLNSERKKDENSSYSFFTKRVLPRLLAA